MLSVTSKRGISARRQSTKFWT